MDSQATGIEATLGPEVVSTPFASTNTSSTTEPTHTVPQDVLGTGLKETSEVLNSFVDVEHVTSLAGTVTSTLYETLVKGIRCSISTVL